MAKIKVLQIDQWTSTGNIKNFTLENFELEKVSGGDSETARAIFGGLAVIRWVDEDDKPPIGNVWFITGPDGQLKLFKANYDSSD